MAASCCCCAVASAPGKLILFGEHAVVYHQPAICAALTDLRITVRCDETWDGFLHIEMPNLVPPIPAFRAKMMDFHIVAALVHKIHDGDADSAALAALQELIHQKLVPYTQEDPTSDDNHDNDTIGNGGGTLHDLAIQAISPVIYLLNAIVPDIFFIPNRGMRILVQSSSLPVGAGLGSSAALSVATSAALYKLSLLHQQQGDGGEGVKQIEQEQQQMDETKILIGRPSDEALQKINHYAYQAERMNHGTPSGLDNTVSCYGGILYFRKNTMTITSIDSINEDNNKTSKDQHQYRQQSPPSFTIEHLDCSPPLSILLTNTMIPRSTKKMVEAVRKMNNEFPDILHGILNSCGAITR
jgi:mevalonate kinase